MFVMDGSPYTQKERIKVRWDIRSFTEVNKNSFMYPAALMRISGFEIIYVLPTFKVEKKCRGYLSGLFI